MPKFEIYVRFIGGYWTVINANDHIEAEKIARAEANLTGEETIDFDIDEVKQID